MSTAQDGRLQYEEQKKELFMEMLKKEEVTAVLRRLEEGTKGAENFQRMKLKKLLASKGVKQGKKFTPWDFLLKSIEMPELKGKSSSEGMKILKIKKDKVPMFIRYISFMKHDAELFDKVFNKIQENVRNEKDILFEIYIEQTPEEARQELLDEFEKSDEKLVKATSKLALDFVEHADEILEITKRLEDVPIEKYTEIELNLIEEGYPMELIPFVYLVAGKHEGDMRNVWYYLAVERLAYRLMSEKKRMYMERTEVDESEDREEGKSPKSVKTAKDKKEESALRKQMKKIIQENKQLEMELKSATGRSLVEKEEILKEVEDCRERIKELTIQTEEQKKELKRFEQKVGGYSLNLATDLSELKLVVGHTSPVLYAPIIFPDIKFIPTQELLNKVQKKTTERVIIQKNGLSYMEYRHVTQSLKDKGIEWEEIDALEEREIIMKVSTFIETRSM